MTINIQSSFILLRPNKRVNNGYDTALIEYPTIPITPIPIPHTFNNVLYSLLDGF